MSTNSLGFGAYYPVDSIIHQLDPRIKIIVTIFLLALIFTTASLWIYLFIGVFLSMVAYLGKVTVICLRRLRSVWVLLVMMTGISMILTAGRPLFPSLTFLLVTYEGAILGLQMALRLVFALTISSILTLTTTPFLMTRGIEALLKPLKKVGVPTSAIAMIIQLTLRFIPTFMQERDKMMKAQSARGYTVDSKNFVEKAKGMLALVVPLLSSAFKRVDELANAMDARGYVVGLERSSLKALKLSRVDYLVMVVVGAMIVIIVLVRG